jgi:hypothetical protein
VKSRSIIQRYRERQAKEEGLKEAEAIVNECVAKRAKYYDVAMLYTLHTVFGFGKDRLRRYYLGMVENYLGLMKQFQSGGDDSHFWVMEARLKTDGIDMDEIVREGNELAKEMESQDEKTVSNSN